MLEPGEGRSAGVEGFQRREEDFEEGESERKESGRIKRVGWVGGPALDKFTRCRIQLNFSFVIGPHTHPMFIGETVVLRYTTGITRGAWPASA